MLQQGIEIYFEQAMDISSRLKKMSENICRMTEEPCMRSMKVIKEAWVGENVDPFIKNYTEMTMGIKENAEEIKKIGDGIEQRLTFFYSSENKNVITAILRSY